MRARLAFWRDRSQRSFTSCEGQKDTEVLVLPVMVAVDAIEADESNIENAEYGFVGLRRHGTGS